MTTLSRPLVRKLHTNETPLTTETWAEVFQNLAEENNFLGYRTVCKQIDRTITIMLNIFWRRLQEQAPENATDFKLLIGRVENHPENDSLQGIGIFRKLAKEFQTHYGKKIPASHVPYLPSHFPSVQPLLDHSLNCIWENICHNLEADKSDAFETLVSTDESMDLTQARRYFNNGASLSILTQEVEELSLSNVDLAVTPPELGKLVGLEALRFDKAQLFGIGDLSTLTKLACLSLKKNSISTPPELDGLTQLEVLDLGKNLLEISPQLGTLNQLNILYLNHNRLKKMPPICGLKNLETLSLRHNLLTEPPQLDGLPRLRELNLGENQLPTPPQLESLHALRLLYLNDNRLEESPLVDQLTNLALLSLENNQIVAPPEVETLTGLTELNLAKNDLLTPPHIQSLKNLELLNLCRNHLEDGPNVSGLTRLRGVYLNNNPDLKNVPGLTTLTPLPLFTIKNTLLVNDPKLRRLAIDTKTKNEAVLSDLRVFRPGPMPFNL